MKTFSFLLSLLFIINTLSAQDFICDTPSEIINLKSANCSNWNVYLPVDPFDTPVKNVRITFHVIQKSDGSGNFPDNAASRDWLQNTLVAHINSKFANLQEMNLPTTSSHITDCRVRVTLANIYFWQDDYGWSYQQTHSFGDYLYNTFVINQSTVLNKYNSVHIFMSENSIGRGRASGFGDKRWITTSGTYTRYLNNNHWSPTNLISHELGHTFGLYHTWNGDNCDDTPNNANCWNVYDPNIPECQIPSNNLMDYNACLCALTICQTNIIHNALLGNIGNISDCVIGSVSVENPQIAGTSLICSNGETYSIENLQLGVMVNWSATPSSFFTSDIGCGNSIFIDPISSVSGEGLLNFEFDWANYGSSSISKNVWVGKALNYEVCDFSSPVINAENILIPGSSCNPMNLIIENGESLLLIGNEVIINQGFEVKLGGEFEVQVSGGCD
jgi:hypothetical protein